MGWVYVPESMDWNLACGLPLAKHTGLFVLLNATPTPRPRTWRGWRTRSWGKRLFGTTSRRSTGHRGPGRFISSLPGIHASRLASPEDAVVNATSATCGPLFDALSEKYGRLSSSWRTCPDTSSSGRNPCLPTWDEWVTRLRQESSARRNWARRNAGRGYSSWATPRAHDVHPGNATRVGRYGTTAGGRNLTDDVQLWQTPATDSFRSRGGDHRQEMGLDQQARKLWQTPRANEAKSSAYHQYNGVQVDTLTGQARTWPTPAARDCKGANGAAHQTNGTGRKHMDQLANFVTHGRPVPTTRTDGGTSSGQTPVLNPRFVEMLMGFPREWSDCTPLEMPSFHAWQQQHGQYYWRALRREADRLQEQDGLLEWSKQPIK